MWPVLCSVVNINTAKVFPLSISVGGNKPLNLDFLQDSINDLNKEINEGVEFEGKRFNVSRRCIICDAQARSMVKCTKLYSGYYGYDNCCRRGKYVGRMTYPIMQKYKCYNKTYLKNVFTMFPRGNILISLQHFHDISRKFVMMLYNYIMVL